MLVDPLTNKPVRTYFMYEDQPPYKRVGADKLQAAPAGIYDVYVC
jgi:hypothetical protein